ncbi:MAG: glycosyltransferase [Ruminococcus sp.]|nr:glycosyltransferase [Ruminococcus sp.]
MKILAINSVPNGSTGTIMREILNYASNKTNAKIASYYGNWNDCQLVFLGSKRYGFKVDNYINATLSKITGIHNVLSISSTLDLIKKIDNFGPDIIHLHNLHLWTISLPLLFKYIKKHNIKTVWTLHDCWAFTGQCPYFSMKKCSKWKTGCHHCGQINVYPSAMVDMTSLMWRLKKKWFTGVKNMIIVTPSHWLADSVKQSYLKEYSVKVINNGIDLSIFKPTYSDFRINYGLENKYLLLGVAFDWGKRKGLDTFIKLSQRLDENYKIVLVGTNDEVDKKLPKNIISIHRTNNQRELAGIYTAADLFVNPTREEVLGMVNIESLACGTPVLTYNTGGCPEVVDENTGCVVNVDDIDELERQIIYICTHKPYSIDNCLRRAKLFDKNVKYDDYIKLYKEI